MRPWSPSTVLAAIDSLVCDLVRLGIGGDLAEHQSLLAAPGRDHVQCRLAAGFVERAAQHLAINCHDALARLGKAGHETLKAVAKLLRVKHPE